MVMETVSLWDKSSLNHSCWLLSVLIGLVLMSSYSSMLALAASSGNESDRTALLAFKYQIQGDPLGKLDSWNKSIHHCDWQGVTCSRRHPGKVVALVLQSHKLSGTLPPYIGNLTFLRNITLTDNNFHGEIPHSIGSLFRLQHLSLDYNSFEGEIPVNLTRCHNLRYLSLVSNKLNGTLSSHISSLLNLQRLHLSINDFVGHIPSSLGNISFLTHLSLQRNYLEGGIPADLCRVGGLRSFQVSVNALTGEFPPCLYNQSSLSYLAVSVNRIEGKLPPNIGLTLPKLQTLLLGVNKFSGLIPFSLPNFTKLEEIDLRKNNFTGPIPMDLGKLQKLQRIHFGDNQLGTETEDDLKFLWSLTNCTNLEYIDIGQNFLKGPLPDSISNMSTKLEYLYAEENKIYGSISLGIENLVNLEGIYLYRNHLTGSIPAVIGKLHKLQAIYLHENRLSGTIPASLGNLTQLGKLVLGGNTFSGGIPLSLGNCKKLLRLDLSSNNLTGMIPKEVLGLSSLALSLDLSWNSLDGPLTSQVGNLIYLVRLIISGNQLSGNIPEALGNCLSLEMLYMDGNNFEGKIPKSLNTLRGLEYFDLSLNKLLGEIPEYIEQFPLLYLNLSFNQLEGRVPKYGVFGNVSLFSVLGNTKLCGGLVELQLPPCMLKTKKLSFFLKVIIGAIVGSLCLLITVCAFLVLGRGSRTKRMPSSRTLSRQLLKRVSYADLFTATNGFSSDNLIGVGSYGSVFKGVLQAVISKTVAVKVFNFHQQGASKSFLTECNALKLVRHRNLLKIITSCSSIDFQGKAFLALVFEFMSNGSLEEWLHPRPWDGQLDPRSLSIVERINIAIDCASAIDYLHHHQPTIVHCDLKPSNILLDDDMTAHVADFGIAKIFSDSSDGSSQSHASSLIVRGSTGYVAPEYGVGSKPSTQGDMYSFGILLLEMFTRKKPTDDMFRDGINLRSYAEMALPDYVTEIVDPLVLEEENNIVGDILQKCLVSMIRLGVSCSAESPVERMTMANVVIELHRIRDSHQQCEGKSLK